MIVVEVVVELIMVVVGPTCESGGGCVGAILVVASTCDSGGGCGGAYYGSGWSYL